MPVQPLPQGVVRVQPPGDRLGVGQRGLLPFPQRGRGLEVEQVVVFPSLSPCPLAFSDRWFPQYSHFTERDT
jgi:hypothetical protein